MSLCVLISLTLSVRIEFLSLCKIKYSIENSLYTMMTSSVKILVWNENKCDIYKTKYTQSSIDGIKNKSVWIQFISNIFY